MYKSIIQFTRILRMAAMFSLLLILLGCAAFSQGGKEPAMGREIDMGKHAKSFDVKIGDRIRTKVDFIYSDVPGFARRIRDSRVGGVGKGEVLVKSGMEFEIVTIEDATFGPMAWVTVSKPFVENRPTPLIDLFGLMTDDGRFPMDLECFERIR